MASYGCVRTYARLLGDEDAAELLQQTLDEEGETDKKLTGLAESINLAAVQGEAEEEPTAKKSRTKR
jgi:ferritin-like metal-binding protein YciE